MSKTITIRIDAGRYEDSDNALADAARDYIAEEAPDLEGWDLEPRWEDDPREAILLTVPMSMRRANERWSAVNNAGNGFAPDEDGVEEAAEAMTTNTGEIILRAETTDDVYVVRDAFDQIVAIGGDGSGKGAWACVIG